MLIYITERPRWIIERTDKPKRRAEMFTSEAAAVAALPNDRWRAKRVSGGRRTICHYHLRNGVLSYCSDAPHALREKSVPLPDLPERYLPDNYRYGGSS